MVERAFTAALQESKIDFPQRLTVPEDRKGKTSSFNVIRLIATGAFALVFEAKVAETGEVVAIKRVLVDKRYKSREMPIAKRLKHPNIVEFRRAFYSKGEDTDETFLNIVTELMPSTLHDVAESVVQSRELLPPLLVKLYTYQMLRAVGYLHALELCHRDVKPRNLLFNPNSHIVKLCDFGSTKKINADGANTFYICSRHYRAPELLMGSTNYTTAVDIWSCGCVCAELIIGTPLFPGANSVDQMVEIMKVLGSPALSDLRALNPAYSQFHFPVLSAHPWQSVFRPSTPKDAIDFISTLIVYNPSARPKAMECLLHPFFDELRLQETKLPNGEPLPDLFNFSEGEAQAAGPEAMRKLKPAWSER